MRRAFFASVIAAGLCVSLQPSLGLSASHGQVAVKVLPVPPPVYPRAPNSLEGVLNSGDFTALVHIKARHYEVRAGEGNAKDVVTRFEGEVIESLRDAGRRPAGRNIDIIQSGGFIDTPEGVIEFVDKSFPRLRPGMKVLGILEWSEYYKAYRFYFGPDGSFELDEPSGKVRTQGKNDLSKRQVDVPIQAFLAQARQLTKR